MSEEPPPPTERSCQRACLRDLLSELGKSTFPSCCPSWKLPFGLVCSLALRLMIQFILSQRPAAVTANFPILRARRPRHLPTPSLGLIDLVNSSLAPPASAPLLLSPSVGRPSAQRPSTLKGQVLVEVLAVYSDFPFSGTITIFDGRAANYIYKPDWLWDSDADFNSRKKEWLATHADSSEFKCKLLLTGPGRGISAFNRFSIFAFIPETDEEYILCYDSPNDYFNMYNEPNTRTMTTSMGSLHVTCAVLTDAVEADLEVMVRLPWFYPFADVHGHVMAYIDTFEVGATIFSRDVDEPEGVPFTDTQEGRGRRGTKFSLPLDRSQVVVPIGSYLHIKGEVVLNGWQTISINHSIPTESDTFETGWPEVDDSNLETHTAVCLTLSSVWV